MRAYFILLFILGMAVADYDTDDGEYGQYTTWRKAVCEKNDHEMNLEMENCFKMEKQEDITAIENCAAIAVPSSEGNTVIFTEEACQNVNLFFKMDECFNEYKASLPNGMLEIAPEVVDCYKNVIEKYDMDTLRAYLGVFTDE